MHPTACVQREPIAVELEHRNVATIHPFGSFFALRQLLGESEVYLLESLAGPSTDCQSAVVGFRPLVEVSVRSGRVALHGVDSLVRRARWAIMAAGVVTGEELELTDRDAFWQLGRVVQNLFDVPAASTDHFGFGFFAFFGYDTGRYVEQLPLIIDANRDVPADAIFSIYQGIVCFDLAAGNAGVFIGRSPEWQSLDVDIIARCIAEAPQDDATPLTVPSPKSVHYSIDREGYIEQVAKCLEHIAVGDIYQVQIGHEIAIDTPVDPITVYRRLRSRNPSPYMCLLPLRGCTVIGASPELFVRIEGDSVTMRPIAGTATKGSDHIQNALNIERLRTDEKEVAEHVMLVDLCRNDLGRIARAKTVEVEDMMCVENFSHVFHLVSTVTAQRVVGIDAYDIVRATFPAGTMTGAPKIRAMEIIERTETSRRGLYAGAFGLIGFGGYMNLGLCIRTLVHRGENYVTRASAGIVADSTPDSEWRETLAKMNATYWAVTGQELL